jgi:predicted phage-related endonuclease
MVSQFLVEAKNYNAALRSKFDAEAGLMPVADMAQLVHEATVFGCETIYLAVLLGGQEFVLIRQDIAESVKEQHIKEHGCAVGPCTGWNSPAP